MAKQLNAKLQNMVLNDCYSNSTDEILLDFDGFTFKCLFHKGSIYFFFNENLASKSRLFKPQFSELKGLKVATVKPHPYERSFQIDFENGLVLLFKCHGRKSNVLLFEEGVCQDTFRRHLESDMNLNYNESFRSIQPEFNVPYDVLKEKYPFLPQEFDTMSLDEGKLQELVNDYRNLNGIEFTKEDLVINASQSGHLLDDISRFSAQAIRSLTFSENKASLIANCQKAISEKENFIAINRKALETLKNRRPEGEIGNIILANLHLIHPGTKSVELLDIYNNSPITVQLDEKLNPIENAERYFKKEKSVPFSVQLLEKKLADAETKLAELRLRLETIENAEAFKSLKQLMKVDSAQSKEESYPYRKFNFQNYEILVGKHADSNEKLLNYYSDKNDAWLHAKDVSGSHVIVKAKGKTPFPDAVLEHAASLAAYYSKNRNQELVTVSHTLRKFVRKIKGADKGKVTISQEKSLLVKPSKGQATS